jgi:aryl-alcohol dehydrogenase-like predicted oxidoreductase
MRATDVTTLGETEVTVTRLGVGTAPIGGRFTAVDARTAEATLTRARQAGLRYFDTAPHYGAGLAEVRLGRSLEGVPVDDYTISTKVGRVLVPGEQDRRMWAEPTGQCTQVDFSYRAVVHSHTESLARLGVPHVDIGLIHDPHEHYAQAMTGAYPALSRLRTKGMLQAVGVGMYQAPTLARFAQHAEFDMFLIAGSYTLLDTSALDELLPICRIQRISVVAAGVFQAGLLADPDTAPVLDAIPQAAIYRDRIAAIRAVCDRHDVPLRAAALQFPAAHPAVASVLVGVRSPAEVDDALAMYHFPIPEQLWCDLKSDKLLPPEAPTPPPP